MNKFLLIVVSVVLVSASTATFAGNRAEEQQDCTDDAFRLCGKFIPNEQAITACMVQKKAQLSPACRRHFGK